MEDHRARLACKTQPCLDFVGRPLEDVDRNPVPSVPVLAVAQSTGAGKGPDADRLCFLERVAKGFGGEAADFVQAHVFVVIRAHQVDGEVLTGAALRGLENHEGVNAEELSRSEIIEAAVAELYNLYEDIGFRSQFTADEFPRERIREMAERAVPGLYAGFSGATNAPENVSDRTVIVAPALRSMTVRQAQDIFEACAA